jgi:hypothetical protein
MDGTYHFCNIIVCVVVVVVNSINSGVLCRKQQVSVSRCFFNVCFLKLTKTEKSDDVFLTSANARDHVGDPGLLMGASVMSLW